MLEQYVDAGLAKFVIRPATAASGSGSGTALSEFLGRFGAELMPLQT